MTKFLWRLAIMAAGVAVCLMAQDNPVLDETIEPVHFETLTYPLSARLTQKQGTVVVSAKLDSEGSVVAAIAISGDKSLIPNSLANVRKWKFRPNKNKVVIVVYRFKIEGLCNLPCPSLFQFEPPNFVTIRIGVPVVDHAGR